MKATFRDIRIGIYNPKKHERYKLNDLNEDLYLWEKCAAFVVGPGAYPIEAHHWGFFEELIYKIQTLLFGKTIFFYMTKDLMEGEKDKVKMFTRALTHEFVHCLLNSMMEIEASKMMDGDWFKEKVPELR
jgi:hypothetical protein